MQEGVDAVVLREPCGNVVIGVSACGRDELCEEECVQANEGAWSTSGGGEGVEEV